MKAWRLYEAGGPEVFTLEERPLPEAQPGWVVIKVRAFGLNRSEWFTRRGESPSVRFPRVLGIECVGTVVKARDVDLAVGQTVFAIMGGMGREFDGSYAEYTCVPERCVFPITSSLPWEVLGALPEMYQTCEGSLSVGLGLRSGETLLIRGGTSSIGLLSLALAVRRGVRVISTTRSEAKRDLLLARGASEVVIDRGHLETEIRQGHPEGVDRVLELIGASTLRDSLRCVRPGGVVCMTGILGGEWSLNEFQPMEEIPSGVRLSAYSGGTADITAEALQDFVDGVAAGEIDIPRGPVWSFDELVKAHEMMDANRANGKMVVVVD